MQAIILAAGRGMRLKPTTDKIPKGMIEVAGRKIIEHNIQAMPPKIDEVIIVIGYLGNKIRKYFKNNFSDRKIQYVQQKKLHGTAHALRLCRRYLNDRFLVLMGDDIYFKNDIKKCMRYKRCLLAKKEKGKFFSAGRNRAGNLTDFRPINGLGLINTGLYILDDNIFKYQMVKLPDGEYGLPQTIATMAHDLPVKVVMAEKWLQINTQDDLEKSKTFNF